MSPPAFRSILPVLPLALALSGAGHAQSLPSSFDLSFSVSRVGDGTQALTSDVQSLFIDNYKLSVAIDTSANIPVKFSTTLDSSLQTSLYASGTDGSRGMLSNSMDYRSLQMAGMTSGGGQQVQSWSAPAVAKGQLTANQQPANLGGGVTGTRGAWSAGSQGFYVATQGPSGTAGIQYASYGSGSPVPSTQLIASGNTDVRQIGSALSYGSGQGAADLQPNLYYSAGSASGGVAGVYQLGAGLPTTSGQAATLLAQTRNGAAANGFFFADLSLDVAGVDTLYVGTEGDGLEKFTYKQTNGVWGWSFTSAIVGVGYKSGLGAYAESLSVLGIDGFATPAYSTTLEDGTTVSVPGVAAMVLTGSRHAVKTNNKGEVTSDQTASELDTLIDLSGYDGVMQSGSLLTLAGGLLDASAARYSLRGVALNQALSLPAVPEPLSYAMLLSGLMLIGVRSSLHRASGLAGWSGQAD
jgi:hypothetical protein